MDAIVEAHMETNPSNSGAINISKMKDADAAVENTNMLTPTMTTNIA